MTRASSSVAYARKTKSYFERGPIQSESNIHYGLTEYTCAILRAISEKGEHVLDAGLGGGTHTSGVNPTTRITGRLTYPVRRATS